MGRAVAAVAIVAILAAAALLALWMLARQERARKLRTERDQLAVTVAKLRNELATQTAAGYFDALPLQAILTDLDERERNDR